jgi:arylsulfatase A-like enzyme
MSIRQPNILWYCTDQQRFDTIGALGNPHIRTPNLDRFVAEGTAFTHAYCQSPICTPSRASFLTGMYPSRVHNPRNGNGWVHREVAANLVTRQLAEAGYDGGLVGKLHLAGAFNGREPRVNDGYRYFKYSHAPRNDWPLDQHDYAAWVQAQGVDPNAVLLHNFDRRHLTGALMEPTPEQDNTPPEVHQTTWGTEASIEFMNQPRPADQPWFLSVNVYDPHPPFNPPWEYYRRYDPEALPGPYFQTSDLEHQSRLTASGIDFQSESQPPEVFEGKKVQAAYYAMIEQIDEQFGRLMDALEASGQAERTIVIFTSDHGESAGDYGLTQKGCRFFDGLSRVPLIWRLPGQIQAGLRSDALVELTDIAPTLLEYAGLPVPEAMQGRSLRPILAGEAAPDTHREFVRCEYLDAVEKPDHTFATMYRGRRWKLNVYHGHGIGELFDMQADPHEHDSLWDSPDHQDIKLDLMQRSFDATVLAADPGPPRVSSY